MHLEDIKAEFPVMPDDMRVMVKQEVEKQLKMAPAAGERRKGMPKKYFLVAFAAVMVMGMTV